jgi:DTW domain-containing protein
MRPTANLHQVLILQHPLEVGNHKGSARLLALSLARCQVLIGESFDPEQLALLLYKDASPLLLYPGHLPLTANDVSGNIRLVVLDATWRKSRKMLYLNPILATLPRLALNAPSPSRYLIRKAQRPEQRSSLEATCAALAQLEPSAANKYEPLLDGFDGFVASLSQRAR